METVDLNFRFNATGNAVPELRKAQGAVKRLDGQIQQSNARMRGFSNGITTMQANTRKFAMGGLQQAGYQVGDYAVQVANGTSKMQAFGQQAPQFLQIFGPIGAVVGAGVAIVAAIGVAFQKSAEAAKEAKPEIISLADAFNRIEDINSTALSETLSKPAREATAEYATLLESMRQVAESQRATAISSIIEEIVPASSVSDLEARLREITRIRAEIKTQGGRAGETMFDDALEKQRSIISELAGELRVRDTILSIQGETRSEAAKNLAAAMDSLQASGNLSDELRTQLVAYGDQIGALSEIQGIIEDADGDTKNLQGGMAALGTTVLSAVDAAYLLSRGILPPQARADLIDLEDGYVAVKASTSEAAVSASGFADAMQRAANAVMNINVNAFSKLQALQAELRGRTRGLSDDQVRIMEAGRRAELAAMEGGVDSSAELAGIAAEASEIERKIIESETALRGFNTTATSGTSAIRQMTVAVDSELSPAMKRLKTIQDTVSSSIESGLMAMVDGTKSVKDAFKSMASEIIRELYRIFVVKRITGMIAGAIGGAGGAPTTSLRPVARSFAGGGYTGDGSRSGGLDGKGGYMAMVHPRETVIDHARGQGSGGVTVIQNNTFGSGVSRAEVNSMIPKIIEATKSAVVDAKLRGGSYGRSFA